MALVRPVPGLVICYSYLWNREYLAGRDEGQKDRPSVVVASIRTAKDGETRVLVLPISHSVPDAAATGVELPAKVKRRLRLDDSRSWVVLSEWNEFVWPGPDVRWVGGGIDPSIAYGMLPPSLFALIRDRFVTLAQGGGAQAVRRT